MSGDVRLNDMMEPLMWDMKDNETVKAREKENMKNGSISHSD